MSIFEKLPPPFKQSEKRNGARILEKDVEKHFKKLMAKKGWSSEKFNSMQKRSVPDQLCGVPAGEHFPTGFIFFVELKRPGQVATAGQSLDHARRRELGHIVFVSDCYGQNEMAIDIVQHMVCYGCIPKLPPYLLR